LGIVSDGYRTHQPREVLETFEAWVQAGGCTLETAGVLLEGAVYFALARIGADVAIDGEGGADKVAPYIYLSTSCNGTRATTTLLTAIRVVCKNTDSAAMNAAYGQSRDSQSHRAEFNPAQAREYIEGAHSAFGAYIDAARKLADVRVNAGRAALLTAQLIGAADIESAAEKRAFKSIMDLFNGAGAGSKLATADGTAWGWYNACTDYTDHSVRATSEEARHMSAQSGAGAKFKARAFELATAI
jgi:phage/plasmid-like protein (TIGR03299 family)